MRRMLTALALLLAPVAAPASAQAAPFRLASLGPAGPCRALPASAPTGQAALHALLAKRLGETVLDCPFPTAQAAAQALATGQADLAALTPEAYGPVAGKVRAILTVNPKGGLGRIPVVAATVVGDKATRLADFKGRRAVFASPAPYDLGVGRQALADQGAGPTFFADARPAGSADAAVARLRSGGADLMVLNGDAWQRTCRGIKPQDKPCADLKVIWRGRPRPPMALAVSSAMPAQLRYRLIGIYVAMHLDSPQAFAAASAFAPGGQNFDAAEAEALSPARAVP